MEITFLMGCFVSMSDCMLCEMSTATGKCTFFSLQTAEGEKKIPLSRRSVTKPSQG